MGTVDAFYEANLELVHVSPELNVYDEEWPIWTYQVQQPPAKFVLADEGRTGMAVNSLVAGGSIISGAVIRESLLFSGVRVEEHSVVERSVIMPDVNIGKRCIIRGAHPRRALLHPRWHADRRRSQSRSRALRRHAARHRAGHARCAACSDGRASLGRGFPVTDQRLPVVLLWHMHQPPYRDALSGRYVLPWTWLHAIKDYTDMAAHLEQVPGAKAVVNFTPVLVEQIEDLAGAVSATLHTGQPLPDALLATLSDAPLPTDAAARLALLSACLRADRENLVGRHAPFAELVSVALTLNKPEHAAYVSDQFPVRPCGLVPPRVDWRVGTAHRCARSRASRPRHTVSMQWTAASCLRWWANCSMGVLPRSVRFPMRARCELAVSPYSHPILPLLLDFGARARQRTRRGPAKRTFLSRRCGARGVASQARRADP